MAATHSALTHLECTLCATRSEPDRPASCCWCGGILLARYDLARAARSLSKASLAKRRRGLWRYAEVLPVIDAGHVVDLGEGSTPVLPLGSARRMGFERLWVKDESANPTGSFKARGMAVAVSRMKELGLTKGVVPTAGNAGLAFAAYAAAARIQARVYMPRDTPPGFLRAARHLGAEVIEVEGTIAEAGLAAQKSIKDEGFFDLSTLKEPYRAEGKKTMGYELWEDLPELPDVIVYPTGGGTGLIGMWKAFDELEQMGLIGKARPRLIAVQSQGCAPVVEAFVTGQDATTSWPAPDTLVSGLRVPSPYAGRMILSILRASGGTAIAVSDDEILEITRRLTRDSGIFFAPEGGATAAALPLLRTRKLIDAKESILLFNTGSGALYLDVLGLAAGRRR